MVFCFLFSLYGAKLSAVTLQELVFPIAKGTADFWVEEFVYIFTNAGCFVDKTSQNKTKPCPILCFQTLLPIRKCLIKMHHVISSCFSPNLARAHLEVFKILVLREYTF